MFPDVTLFLDFKLYDLCLLLAVISALVVARVYADKLRISPRLQTFGILLAVVAVVAGYASAVLFQAVYDYTAHPESGFVINRNTGATFYGGLIGGAAVFLIVYFTLGKKLCGEEAISAFEKVLGIAACSIAIAHGIGRIGCFLGGCCYGRVTDSPIGVYFPHLGAKIVPVQLFEAIFLFLLFALLTVLLFKTRVNGIAVYMLLYGVFRFIIEFFRDDDRGASIIPGLSPSQVWSVVLVIAGAALLAYTLWRTYFRKREN